MAPTRGSKTTSLNKALHQKSAAESRLIAQVWLRLGASRYRKSLESTGRLYRTRTEHLAQLHSFAKSAPSIAYSDRCEADLVMSSALTLSGATRRSGRAAVFDKRNGE